MVQDIPRTRQQGPFPDAAPAAFPVFYRTYSRRGEVVSGQRETWDQVCDRTLEGLKELGNLTDEEMELLNRMQRQVKALPSGRWLWVGGTAWSKQPENFSGAYNCTSTNVVDWRAFGLMMDLAMMGCGTGAILEPKYIGQIPAIRNRLTVTMGGDIGTTPAADRREITEVSIDGNRVNIRVGDSRQGWVQSYQTLLELSTDERFTDTIEVTIDLRDVRPAGEKLKGFGGVANPIRLSLLYDRCANILNKALGRQLNSVECCLLIDEAAACVVAGNIRRCLPEDALVHTEAGLVPIAKVRIGDRVLTSKGLYPVTNFFVQGEQSLCRIRTQDGEFECTADHKVAVLTDVFGQYQMVKAKDLNAGDRLVFVPQAIPGTATELPEFRGEIKGKTKPIQVPALTTQVAYFLGYLQGDGSVASDGWRVRFQVHEDSPAILDRLIEVGQEFGLDTHTLRTPEQCKTKAYELQFNSSALNQYLQQFKQASQPLTVPDCILLGTSEIRKAFLAGLADADGCHSQGVLVASVHKRFLQQVQALYASLGITVRMCSSVRKRTNQWEGELVTVGQAAFEAVASAFETHSIQFSVNRRETPKRFNDHGFPKDMVKPLVSSTLYHWGAVHKQMNQQTLKKYVPNATDLVPVKVKGVDLNVRTAPTYDIEVATVHEFMCEGILVSNSAGMRQFDSSDELAAGAKDNLWQQDAEGNWRIDPERDVLRMANHTRVFHEKPSLQDCVDSVRKQFYSGEGAIQWAGEAKRRAGADDRYGLNPCVTADTWVHTGDGPRQVKDLIGQQHSTYVNGELFSTTAEGFFYSGTKAVLKLTTQEGHSLRLTGNHKVLKVTAQTQKAQYTEWVEAETLQPGDCVLLHNHRGLQPWDGKGTREAGWLLGNLVGDGSLAKTQWNDSALLRFWGESQEEMSEHAIALLKTTVGYERRTAAAHYHHRQLKHRVVNSAGLASLAAEFGITPGHKEITTAIEQGSYEFYQGFLQGLFDADGSVQGSQAKGISVRLAQSNLANLQAVQRMSGRLGIVSTIYQERRPEGYRDLPNANREPAPYFCQTQHELVIANDNLQVFADLIGFQEPAKADKLNDVLGQYKRRPNRERFTATVSSVVPDGVEAVYDCTVPGPARFDANGLVAHNCGEILGSNFHCVSGSTLLITRDGLHPIQSLVGQSVEVWNGRRWSQVVPVQTGQNRQMYRVTFGDGTWLDVTGKHRFFVGDRFTATYKELTTEELRDRLDSHPYALHTEPFKIDYRDGEFVDPTWAYTLGQLVGDGSLCQSKGKPQLQLRLYGPKSSQSLALAGRTSGKLHYYAENSETPCLLYTGFQDNFDPEQVRALKGEAQALEALASWNREGILHFIAGLIDADGSETPSGGVRLYISDYDRAYRLYLLLLKCGIRSSINLAAKAGSQTNLGIRQRDLWYLQITDCAAIPCQRVDTSKGHAPKTKGKWQVIRSVEPIPGQHDSFCFNEPEFHKGVFGGTLTGQCNLAEVHLNQLDPANLQDQENAFTSAALSVAVLLNHQFNEPRYQQSRLEDPIVGVSFTGLFDFFVQAFGVDWLRWWEAGRPDTMQGLEFKQKEQAYLSRWKDIVHRVVWDYCDRHGLKQPNRCTTVQPAGTKSLLTGASPGWHPPKAQRFLRRITFRKNDPVAMACIDYGYSVVPSQSDKDENGNLLNDPFDPRCTEWLVEIPVEVPWANLPGADEIAIEKFTAAAQFDFYMQVQKHYTTHNTSATIEFREPELEALGERIYQAIQNDEGYISAALLARFDDLQTFPRLPFEPIDKATYEAQRQQMESRRGTADFHSALALYDAGDLIEAGPAGCDSDKCMMPEQKPE
jgi:ribonucleotide reductase class II